MYVKSLKHSVQIRSFKTSTCLGPPVAEGGERRVMIVPVGSIVMNLGWA